jgi:hypothetical protein
MSGVITRALVAAVLFVAGGALWTAGQVDRRTAAALRETAALRFDDATRSYDEVEQAVGPMASVPWLGDWLLREVEVHRAVARYWTADYTGAGGAVTGDVAAEADPALLLSSANSVYRATTARGVGELGRVMNVYAEVLKREPGHADAAYNYEFLARTRAVVAR